MSLSRVMSGSSSALAAAHISASKGSRLTGLVSQEHLRRGQVVRLIRRIAEQVVEEPSHGTWQVDAVQCKRQHEELEEWTRT